MDFERHGEGITKLKAGSVIETTTSGGIKADRKDITGLKRINKPPGKGFNGLKGGCTNKMLKKRVIVLRWVFLHLTG